MLITRILRRGYTRRTTSHSRFSASTSLRAWSSMADSTSSASEPITVDIVSDTVCPWCYVGVKRMEQAFAEAKLSPPPEVKWHPFFLQPPGHAPDGMPIEEYLNRKYGPGMASRANGALAAAGNECGIKFVFEGRMVCDTLKSHLLVDYARQFGKEDAMVKMLFKYYFEAINNVNNVDVLVKAAEEVGLNGEDVRRYLDSGDGKEHVMKEVKEYTQRFRISGVPFFIVSKKGKKKRFVFSGAQDKDFWLEALEQAQQITE